MNNKEKMNQLNKMLEQIDLYNRTIGKLYFDMECICPKNGLEKANEDINELSQVVFKIQHSKKYEQLVVELNKNHEELNEYEVKCIDNLYKKYEKNLHWTSAQNRSFNKASGDAYISWLKCKEESNYKEFAPYLNNVIKMNKKYYLSQEHQKETLYDTILNDYEEGLSITKLDEFFGLMKTELIPLIKKIQSSDVKIRRDFLTRNVPISEQEKFSQYLNIHEGLNMDSLVLMTTEHPFTTGFGEGDERITTHYYENNFISNIFSCLHEGGHALFDMGEPHIFHEYHIAQNMTMSMHECMSRLFENMIGRSRSFVNLIYPTFQEMFNKYFSDVSEEELYRAINIAEPSLIRTEADELTYPLHILIRYELEKEIINNDKLNVKTLNKKWNDLYKEYLGVEVPSDKEGILQDVHWTGNFGYFPSYALGSAYAAQIMHTMRQQIDVDQLIKDDKISVIVDWLKNNVWKYASIMNTKDWLIKITGEEFNPKYYIEYLKEKFINLYSL